MALNETQQIVETLKRSRKPLICVPSGAGADGYASAIGISAVLKKLGKTADIVAADGVTPKALHFLAGHADVKPAIEYLRRFVIELDATKAKVKELSYEMKDGKLLIHLTPTSGTWDPTDVKLTSSGYRYDLIICVGAPDLESCGELYRAHPDFFFSTPILNIDHTPENERYGQLNAVDLTAAACGEVCHDLFESIDPGLLDEASATAFLTGMISKTKSFKRTTVTPRTLQTAGKLVARGARREEAVQHLYRTRTVQTLRLWGRTLARLKHDASAPLVWALLTREDFIHAGAMEADLPDVIDELITSSPDAKVVAIIYERTDGTVHALVHAERPFDALFLAAPLKPTGNREDARVTFAETGVVAAEKSLIERLKTSIISRA